MAFKDPIPPPILLVAHEANKIFLGFSTIVGSSAARKLYYELHRDGKLAPHLEAKMHQIMQPCYVDITVAARPRRLKEDKDLHWNTPESFWSLLPYKREKEIARKFNRSVIRTEECIMAPVSALPGEWFHQELQSLSALMDEKHGIRLEIDYIEDYDIGKDMGSSIFVDYQYSDYRTLNFSNDTFQKLIYAGIIRIYHVHVTVDSQPQQILPRIRFVLIDSYPQPNESWADHITGRFDISIFKGIIRTRRKEKMGSFEIDIIGRQRNR